MRPPFPKRDSSCPYRAPLKPVAPATQPKHRTFISCSMAQVDVSSFAQARTQPPDLVPIGRSGPIATRSPSPLGTALRQTNRMIIKPSGKYNSSRYTYLFICAPARLPQAGLSRPIPIAPPLPRLNAGLSCAWPHTYEQTQPCRTIIRRLPRPTPTSENSRTRSQSELIPPRNTGIKMECCPSGGRTSDNVGWERC